jgi:excinuclease ABC subunit C
MIRETKKISFIKVNSELEALLLEAKLVKQTKPKYNIQLKDGKRPLYIKITKEKYPRVLTARQVEKREKNIAFFGPFPSAKNVKTVLKMLRKVFPYSTHKIGKKPCLYSQIGLCHPCPSQIELLKNEKKKKLLRKRYLENINLLKAVLSGKLKSTRKNLVRKMQECSKEEKFEKAASLREKIEKLDYITQPTIPVESFVKNPNLIEDIRKEEIKKLSLVIKNHIKLPSSFRLERIECFDISHLAGICPAASMVTFIKGEPDKSYYRHFRIQQKKGQDDISSMKEVAKRRKNHLVDWEVPDLIVVDGGKTQVAAFLSVFDKHKIPIVGITKKNENLIIPVKETGDVKFKKIPLTPPALNLVQRLRDEAHRFARSYHHKLLQMLYLKK